MLIQALMGGRREFFSTVTRFRNIDLPLSSHIVRGVRYLALEGVKQGHQDFEGYFLSPDSQIFHVNMITLPPYYLFIFYT
jgi:hypothetical protein